MSKKSKKPISEREKARRKAAAEAARAKHAEPPPDKQYGRDLHAATGAARIIRHQGR